MVHVLLLESLSFYKVYTKLNIVKSIFLLNIQLNKVKIIIFK